MRHKRFIVAGLTGLLLADSAFAIPLTPEFTYQGQLGQSGMPANGVFDFRFGLYDAATLGNAVGAVDVIDDVAVTDGLFNVILNNSQEFGASAFNGQSRWLEIQVRPNGGGAYTTLTPRQPVTAAPYALYALSGPGSGGFWTANGNNIYNTNTGNVGIGTSAPNANAKLHVAGNARVDGGVIADGGYVFVYDNNNPGSLISAHNDGTGPAGQFTARQGDAVDARSWGSGTAVSGFSNSTGRAGAFEIDNASNSAPALYAAHNGSGPAVSAWNVGTGRAGQFIATSNATALHCQHSGSGTAFNGQALGTGGAGAFEVNNASNSQPAIYAAHNGSGPAVSAWNVGTGRAGQFIGGPSSSATALHCQHSGTGTAFASHALGTGRAGHFRNASASSGADALLCENAGTGFGIYAVTGGNPFSSGVMGVGTSANSSGVIGEANNGTQAFGVWGRAAQGIGGVFEGGTYALVANGTARVNVLEIVGADVAEKFPTSEELKPGMVAAIDPKNPGKLCLARSAYNRCVAGVVSGAGDLPVGAVLGNLPASESGPPIALSGRVWVYCDAADQAIEPGDLLTTSDTPGHAMRVSDLPRAQGAIIGKAMTRLPQGETGLVLVLVNLQ